MSNGFWKPDRATQRAINKMEGKRKKKRDKDKYGLDKPSNHIHNRASWDSRTWMKRHTH